MFPVCTAWLSGDVYYWVNVFWKERAWLNCWKEKFYNLTLSRHDPAGSYFSFWLWTITKEKNNPKKLTNVYHNSHWCWGKKKKHCQMLIIHTAELQKKCYISCNDTKLFSSGFGKHKSIPCKCAWYLGNLLIYFNYMITQKESIASKYLIIYFEWSLASLLSIYDLLEGNALFKDHAQSLWRPVTFLRAIHHKLIGLITAQVRQYI